MVKVSVIVPVYNGEKHLAECMDSICGQSLQEIEIICVDDGSNDSSVEILESYRAADPRIQILQQNHLYAGTARNAGKTKATGEYLVFWDCDDYFDLSALEKLYNRAKETNADVCVCGGNQYYESKQKEYPCSSYLLVKCLPDADVFNRFTWPDYYLYFTNRAAWNKIFRRQYIEELRLDFQPIRNGNDVYFTEVALGLADRISVLDEKLVTYRINQTEGLVNSLAQSALSPIQAWMDIAEELEKHPGFGERCFANKALGSMVYMLRNIQEWKAFSEAYQVLREYGLEKMHILPQEDYYYDPWKGECAKRLYQDSAEEFALFLAHSMYSKRLEALAERRAANERIKKVKEINQQIRDKNDNLRNKNDDLRNKNDVLRNRDNELKSRNEDLRGRNEALRSKNKELREKNTVLREKNKETTEQVHKHKEIIRKLRDSKAQLEAENERLSSDSLQKQQEVERLTKELQGIKATFWYRAARKVFGFGK